MSFFPRVRKKRKSREEKTKDRQKNNLLSLGDRGLGPVFRVHGVVDGAGDALLDAPKVEAAGPAGGDDALFAWDGH